MPQFTTLPWQFEYSDRGTHSGNYLDKLNQLVNGFNTTIAAYNAQLIAETDAEAMKVLAQQFRNEAEAFRNEAEAISIANINGTTLDLTSCKVGGIDVALINGTINNANKLGNQLPTYYAKQSDINALTALVASDDTALNTIQEIVDFIELNRDTLDALTISSIAGLVAALAGKSAATHDHDGDYLFKHAKADTALVADNAIKLNGITAGLYAGLANGSSTQNPNTAINQVILTRHANTPNLTNYWHITTTFYSTISATANRSQLAIQYDNGNKVYARVCNSNVWTAWVRCDNNGKSADTAKFDGKTRAEVIAEARSDLSPNTWRNIGTSVTTSSSSVSASLTAVKITYDKAVAAFNESNNSKKLEGKTKTQVVAEAKAAFSSASKAANGWWKDQNTGLIIQWGRNSIPYNVLTPVNFPLAFPGQCCSVTVGDQTGANGNTRVYLTSKSQVSFKCAGIDITGTGVKWMAIGY